MRTQDRPTPTTKFCQEHSRGHARPRTVRASKAKRKLQLRSRLLCTSTCLRFCHATLLRLSKVERKPTYAYCDFDLDRKYVADVVTATEVRQAGLERIKRCLREHSGYATVQRNATLRIRGSYFNEDFFSRTYPMRKITRLSTRRRVYARITNDVAISLFSATTCMHEAV